MQLCQLLVDLRLGYGRTSWVDDVNNLRSGGRGSESWSVDNEADMTSGKGRLNELSQRMQQHTRRAFAYKYCRSPLSARRQRSVRRRPSARTI